MKTAKEIISILNELNDKSENAYEQLFCLHEINYITYSENNHTFDFDAFVRGLKAFINNHDCSSPRVYINAYVEMMTKLLEKLV